MFGVYLSGPPITSHHHIAVAVLGRDGSLPILALGFAVAGIESGCVETAEHADVANLALKRLRPPGSSGA